MPEKVEKTKEEEAEENKKTFLISGESLRDLRSKRPKE